MGYLKSFIKTMEENNEQLEHKKYAFRSFAVKDGFFDFIRRPFSLPGMGLSKQRRQELEAERDMLIEHLTAQARILASLASTLDAQAGALGRIHADLITTKKEGKAAIMMLTELGHQYAGDFVEYYNANVEQPIKEITKSPEYNEKRLKRSVDALLALADDFYLEIDELTEWYESQGVKSHSASLNAMKAEVENAIDQLMSQE